MAACLMAVSTSHAGTRSIYSEDFSSAPTVKNAVDNGNTNRGGTGDGTNPNDMNQDDWYTRGTRSTLTHTGGTLEIDDLGTHVYFLMDLTDLENDPGAVTNFTLSFDVVGITDNVDFYVWAGGGLDYNGSGTGNGHLFFRMYNDPPLFNANQGATRTLLVDTTIPSTTTGTFSTNVVLTDLDDPGDYVVICFGGADNDTLTIDDLEITFIPLVTDYYWDNDGDTAGFGTAGGTWADPTVNQWSTDDTGASVPEASYTTLTNDTLYFGTVAVGLGEGTITSSGSVSANKLIFGSASGAITLSGGTITLGGTTPTVVVSNTTDTIGSVLTGTDGMTKVGSGTLALTGTNTYTGNTTINTSGGTLQVAGAGKLGSGSYAGGVSIGSSSTFDYSSSANQTLSGVVSGDGALTMAGGGALTLDGTSTYSGNTTVSDGTLLVNGSLGASSTVTVGNGATLGGTGTVNGGMIVASGGTNAPGTSTGVLTAGSDVTFQSGSTLAIEIDDGQAPKCDKLAVSGALDISGGILELDVTAAAEDTYVIATYPSGQLTGSFSAVNGMPAGYALMTFYNSGTEIALVKVSSLSSPVWDGDNDGYWNDGVNWVGDALPVEGDNLVFTGGSHLTTTNDFAAGTAFSLEFDGTGFDLTGASIELADNGDNDIAATAGTNTISLNVALTNDSHANVSAGRLEIDGAISGAHSLSKISAGTLVLNGTGNSVSELNAAGGNLVLASNSTTAVSVDMYVGRDEVTGGGDGTLIVTNDASLTVDGKFHMGRQHNHVGTVNQAGGTVTLNNAEVRFGIYNGAHGNYTLSSGILNATDANVVVGWDGYGTFSVNGGTANVKGVGVALRGIDAAEVDTLTLGGGTLNVGSDGIDQSQGQYYNVNLNSGTLGALDDWPSDADMTLGGPIDIDTAGYTVTLSGVLSGAGGFTKKGSGILALSGANSYTGETVVADGELHLDSGAELNTNTIVRISSGAKMDLDANINETVAELWLGGSQQLPGTWGAAAPPAEHAAPAYFQGGGILTVTSGRGKFGTVVLAD